MLRIDFVIPVYNEEESLPEFHRMLRAVELPPGFSATFIYVDDGSIDGTPGQLDRLAASDDRVHPIHLSRNFGHQAALSAGIDAASGDIVITMDGDGQHPPALVLEMLKLHVEGHDVVQAQRLDDGGISFKRTTSRMFYRLIRGVGEVQLVEGASDFRLMSRQAVDALRQLPEYHRFLRGMIAWIGYQQVILPYRPGSRIGGEPKYSLKKMLRLASDGFFSFSLVPLRIALFLGLFFIVLAAGELSYVAYVFFSGHQEQIVPGWTSLILLLTLSGAINMVLVGILGIYVGMIFHEVKRRPVYLVKSEHSKN